MLHDLNLANTDCRKVRLVRIRHADDVTIDIEFDGVTKILGHSPQRYCLDRPRRTSNPR
jgi:hypothetical protein